jgi:hypothetical protein
LLIKDSKRLFKGLSGEKPKLKNVAKMEFTWAMGIGTERTKTQKP